MPRPCSPALALLLALPLLAAAFYLPGIAPVDYEEGAELDVFANKLTSPVNKLPYNYFSLPLCKPSDGAKPLRKRLNLGQYLIGERALRTEYALNMRVDTTSCAILCEITPGEFAVKKLSKLIDDKYNVRLNVDNMPVVMRGKLPSGEDAFEFGYPLGTILPPEQGAKHVLFNHLKFTVLYHQPDFALTEKYIRAGNTPVYRVVGFEVEIDSIAHVRDKSDNSKLTTCPPADGSVPTQKPGPAVLEVGKPIIFSYTTTFKESAIRWATRWDPLLKPPKMAKQVQWFAITNSFIIALFLAGVVALILLRTLHQDFVRYNRLDDEQDLAEESGWKMVHADVFRPPQRAALLAILYGCGAHITWLFSATLIFAVLGFLSPANRGGLLSAMVTTWVFTSFIPGFAARRLYASFGGTTHKFAVTIGSALLFSGLAFATFFFMNFVMWLKGSSGAVPFLTLLLLLFLWIFLSLPLAFVGAYVADKMKAPEYPARTNQIPREVPPPPYGVDPRWYPLVSGTIPFGVIFVELSFVMSSLWQNRVFYMFGFLFLVFLLLLITSAEVAVVLTYVRLIFEDHNWWWGAFFYNATLGLYLFAYSFVYYVTQTDLDVVHHFISTLLYFGYMGVISVGLSLMVGFVGFFASLVFVKNIYGAIRID